MGDIIYNIYRPPYIDISILAAISLSLYGNIGPSVADWMAPFHGP